MTTNGALALAAAAGIAVLAAIVIFGLPPQSQDLTPEEAATMTVEEFGKRLKNVSLMAPAAADDIEEEYSPFVAPELLAAWQAAPQEAPGRLTSSPYPERIDIESVTKAGDDYLVEGTILLMSSTGVAGEERVTLTLKLREGKWLITGYLPQGGFNETGRATIGIGERADIDGIGIEVVEVLEDSRCPADVQCIQAGTVRLAAIVYTDMGDGSAEQDFTLLQIITTETHEVELVEVAPAPRAGEAIASSTYQFTFEVRQRTFDYLD